MSGDFPPYVCENCGHRIGPLVGLWAPGDGDDVWATKYCGGCGGRVPDVATRADVFEGTGGDES